MTTPPTTTPNQGPVPLGGLLSETLAYCKAHWQPLAVGIVAFGIFSSLFVVYSVNKIVPMIGGTGFDMQKMEKLSVRIEAGDEAAVEEFEALIANGVGTVDFDASLKIVLYFILIGGLILLFNVAAYLYYTIVAVEGKDVNGTMLRVFEVFLPLLGISFWSLLRSFVWIPFIGTILCIILGPRFVAAPLIFLMEGKGVMASVSDSYVRTRGYWGKIVGNMIVAVWLMGLVVYVANIGLSILLQTTSVALILTGQIVSSMAIAFFAAFSVRLSHTILQHPRA